MATHPKLTVQGPPLITLLHGALLTYLTLLSITCFASWLRQIHVTYLASPSWANRPWYLRTATLGHMSQTALILRSLQRTYRTLAPYGATATLVL